MKPSFGSCAGSPCNALPRSARSLARAGMDASRLRLHAALRDGTAVCVRAIRPDDKARMRDAFGLLSPETVYKRFFHHLTELTPGVLRAATELDFHDHVGLAVTVGAGAGERLIAVAQLVRLVPGADRAEVAFVVVDDYQHRGAATLLLRHIVRCARRLGVREIFASVLPDNRAMLDVLEQSGLPLRQGFEEGVRRVVLSLERAG